MMSAVERPSLAKPRLALEQRAASLYLDAAAFLAAYRTDPHAAILTLRDCPESFGPLRTYLGKLTVYYGSDKAGGYQTLDRPLRTLTTLDRFGLVQWDGSHPTLRMLQVPELRRAMGVPEEFRLGFGTRRDRIRLLGNGVCPPVMTAVVRTLLNSSRQVLSRIKTRQSLLA